MTSLNTRSRTSKKVSNFSSKFQPKPDMCNRVGTTQTENVPGSRVSAWFKMGEKFPLYWEFCLWRLSNLPEWLVWQKNYFYRSYMWNNSKWGLLLTQIQESVQQKAVWQPIRDFLHVRPTTATQHSELTMSIRLKWQRNNIDCSPKLFPPTTPGEARKLAVAELFNQVKNNFLFGGSNRGTVVCSVGGEPDTFLELTSVNLNYGLVSIRVFGWLTWLLDCQLARSDGSQSLPKPFSQLF